MEHTCRIEIIWLEAQPFGKAVCGGMRPSGGVKLLQNNRRLPARVHTADFRRLRNTGLQPGSAEAYCSTIWFRTCCTAGERGRERSHER